MCDFHQKGKKLFSYVYNIVGPLDVFCQMLPQCDKLFRVTYKISRIINFFKI